MQTERLLEKVHLLFGGSFLSEPTTGTGRIIFQSRDHKHHTYEFRCGPDVKAALDPAKNRRRYVRVRPSASEPITGIIVFETLTFARNSVTQPTTTAREPLRRPFVGHQPSICGCRYCYFMKHVYFRTPPRA